MTLFPLIKAGTTLLGTNPVRFFEFGHAPSLAIAPYVTWQELTVTPFNCVDGPPTTDLIKIQIDVWGNTTDEARAVVREIRLALQEHGTFTFASNGWDSESSLFRSILHFVYTKEI